MDEGDVLWHRLIKGEVSYPEIFDLAVTQVPQLATVQLDEIERIAVPVAPKPSPVASWLFKRILRALGLSKSQVAGIGKVPRIDLTPAQRQRAALLHSVHRFATDIADHSSSHLWSSTAGRGIMTQYLFQRFALELLEEGEPGTIRAMLFAGETSYAEIFEVMNSRESRLNVSTISEVKGTVARLPIMTQRRQSANMPANIGALNDQVAVMLFVDHLVGPQTDATDALLRSRLAVKVGTAVLNDRLGLDISQS